MKRYRFRAALSTKKNTKTVCQAAGGAKSLESVLANIFFTKSRYHFMCYRYHLRDIITSRIYLSELKRISLVVPNNIDYNRREQSIVLPRKRSKQSFFKKYPPKIFVFHFYIVYLPRVNDYYILFTNVS